MALEDVFPEVRHLYRGLGAVFPLLRRARLRLRLGVGGEDAVGHGDAGVELHLHEARCGFVGDDLEMTGLAAYHGAERDQRVVLLRVGEFLQGERRLERTGHRHHGKRGDAQFG